MKRVFNKSTAPLFLPIFAEEQVAFKEEVEDESGFLRTARQFRTETRIKDVVAIEGCHHEKMHDPNFADVTDDEFDRLTMCPGWDGLVASKRVRFEDLGTDEDAE